VVRSYRLGEARRGLPILTILIAPNLPMMAGDNLVNPSEPFAGNSADFCGCQATVFRSFKEYR
jgi:hypothetical protein